MWEDNHKHNKRNDENRNQNDGNAVEVLLNNARSLIRTIDARSDHIRDARALTRMKQDKNDESNARYNEQNSEDDCKY